MILGDLGIIPGCFLFLKMNNINNPYITDIAIRIMTKQNI